MKLYQVVTAFLLLILGSFSHAQVVINSATLSNPIVAGQPVQLTVILENEDLSQHPAEVGFIHLSGPSVPDWQTSDPSCTFIPFEEGQPGEDFGDEQPPGTPTGSYDCGSLDGNTGSPLKKRGSSKRNSPGIDFTASQASVPGGSSNQSQFVFSFIPEAGSYEMVVSSVFCLSSPNCDVILNFTADQLDPEINANLQTSVDENAGQATLSFSLSQPGNSDIALEVNTLDGSAKSGEDYQAVSQTVLWPAGDSSQKTVIIPIIDDQKFEGDETFQVELTQLDVDIPVNSPLSFQITINEDDPEPPGTIQWTQSQLDLNEDSGTITLTAQRIEGAAGNISVSYQTVADTATADLDFQTSQGSLSWSDGDSADKTVSITINKDLLQEEVESFIVELNNPTGGALIGNPKSVELKIADVRDPQAPNVDVGADIEVTDFDGDGNVEVNLDASNSSSLNSEIDKVEWIFEGKVIANGIKATALLPVGKNQVTARITNKAGLISEKILNVLVKEQQSSRQDKLASTPGIDRNERSLAESLDNLCPRLAEVDQLNPLSGAQKNLLTRCNGLLDPDLSDEDQAAALQAIAGEEVAALLSTATDFASVQQSNIRTRLTQLRRGGGGIDLSGLNIQTDSGTLNGNLLASALSSKLGGAASGDEDTYLLESSRWGVFLNGNILYGDKDKTDAQNGYDLDVKGLTMGLDYRITDNTVAGLAIGFADTDLDYKQNGGTMDAESQFVTAYGSYYDDKNYYIDVSVTRGNSDYDMLRRVEYKDMFGQVNAQIDSSTSGRQLLATFDAGYDFIKGPFIIGPNLGVSYNKTNIDQFNERGNSGLELAYGSQEASMQSASLGWHSSYTMLRDWGVLTAQFNGNYYRDIKNDEDQVIASFVHDPFGDSNSPLAPMVVRTDAIDKSYMTFNLALAAQFQHGLSGFVDYRYLAGASNISSAELSFGMRYELKF
ncbi:autotransporter domain-containing protein [uncultured Pseudoteredinibacter sp.]|uniref:autotransporter domain-containing protein n=1 Tax=uncultured Pseudoteredinibacter sp. TaxID=1641701 RepID=UPI002616DB25|nr:autotransporter domain-containing protein [uncultured Pseudoteredinibacter sp.]